MVDKIWLRGEYEFASLFSYRLPDFSSAYAPSSPMPGPSAVKLALVATAIETNGKVADGERIFEIVHDARIGLETSESLTVSRVLLKRLKRIKDGTIDASYGTREYVHFGGSISIYIEVDTLISAKVVQMMNRLRRIGTSESLLYIRRVEEQPPNQSNIAKTTLEFNNLATLTDLARRPIFRLKDIRRGATFAQANPFSGKPAGNFLEECYYVFPLRIHKQGRNWVWYKREPFLI